MKIGVILATTQRDKKNLICETVKQYAKEDEVIDFGCSETENYSYIEISILIGLLISSKAVDFIITGCSSGQGMMIACNSMPGVICGYVPTPMDAYLYVQINNGNVVSLPLGEEYTYSGEKNLKATIKKMFKEPFGGGYPKAQAERKIKDSNLLKEIKREAQKDFVSFIEALDKELINKVLDKKDVIGFINEFGKNKVITEWINEKK